MREMIGSDRIPGNVVAQMLILNDDYALVIHNDDPDSDRTEWLSVEYDAYDDELSNITEHETDFRAYVATYAKVIKRLAGGYSPDFRDFGIFFNHRDDVVNTFSDNLVIAKLNSHGAYIGYDKKEDNFFYGPADKRGYFNGEEFGMIDIDDLAEDPDDELRDEFIKLRDEVS